MKRGVNGIYVLIAVFCAVFGALGQLFFKLGSSGVTFNALSWINPSILAGVLFYGISTVVFILILKKAELSLLYPVIATSYIWVALLSILVVGETVSTVNWLGFALIIGGVTLTSVKKW